MSKRITVRRMLKIIYNQIIETFRTTNRNLLHIIWTLVCLGIFLLIVLELHQDGLLPGEREVGFTLAFIVVLMFVWVVVTGLIGDPDN